MPYTGVATPTRYSPLPPCPQAQSAERFKTLQRQLVTVIQPKLEAAKRQGELLAGYARATRTETHGCLHMAMLMLMSFPCHCYGRCRQRRQP